MDPTRVKDLTHLLHTVSVSDSLSVRLHRTVLESGLVGSLIVNDEELKFSNHHKEDLEYKPEVNDLVYALHGENWYRGLVHQISDQDIKVALVDYGTVIKPKALCRLPPEDTSIWGTAVRVTLTNGTHVQCHTELIGSKIQVISINEIEGDMILCNFESIGEAYIIPWEPCFEDYPEETIKVAPSTKMTVSKFFTPRLVYLQRFDQTELIEMLRDLKDRLEKTSPLKRLPFCGELVACLHVEDDIYYRTKVSKVDNGLYYLNFVDFGSYACVGLDILYMLPEDFKKYPYQAIEVGISGLPCTNFNCPATQLMSILTGRRIKLKFSYGIDQGNVELFTGNESINEKLEVCMKSTTNNLNNQKGLNPDNIFQMDDLIYRKLKVGNEFPFKMIEWSGDLFVLAKSTLHEPFDGIENLEEEFSEDSYAPVEGEVCLAKYNGWMRAICFEVHDSASDLIFIDRGIIMRISNTEIRPMTYQYMTVPVNLKECVIYGLNEIEPELKKSILQNLDGQTLCAVVLQDLGCQVIIFVPKLNDFLRPLGISEIIQPPISNL